MCVKIEVSDFMYLDKRKLLSVNDYFLFQNFHNFVECSLFSVQRYLKRTKHQYLDNEVDGGTQLTHLFDVSHMECPQGPAVSTEKCLAGSMWPPQHQNYNKSLLAHVQEVLPVQLVHLPV